MLLQNEHQRGEKNLGGLRAADDRVPHINE